MATAERSWISAHLFYHGDLSALLVACIQPLIASLEEAGLIERCFFVRYWQGGPHLRLRLLPRAESAAPQIVDAVRRAATDYFQRYPAPDTLDHARYNEVSSHLSRMEYGHDQRIPLYPNNSLHFLPYTPEYAHYGGPQAMPFVEQHFSESSAIALTLLAQGANRNQRTAHSIAAMLLTAALASPARASTARVIEHFYCSWERMPADLRTHLLARFDQHYESQRQTLERLTERLLRLSTQEELGESPAALDRWLSSIRQLYQRLCTLEQAGALALQTEEPPATPAGQPPSTIGAPLNILLRCAHMHNNRLGLLILDEAYVLHLLKRALNETNETSETSVRAGS